MESQNRFPAGMRISYLLHIIHIGFEVHPVYYPVGPVVFSREDKDVGPEAVYSCSSSAYNTNGGTPLQLPHTFSWPGFQ
jgi:hypothetical protein